MNDPSNPLPPPKTTGGGWRWEPPAPEELQRMLPQYEVQMLIGRGGMGAVYKGVQLSLERLVAIKLLPPAIEQQDVAFAERFKNEAKLMGRMNHPAIVSVYDFGRTTDGQLYFVMEFVDGTDVQRMIAREGRLPPEHALAVTAHLCDALGYAHKQGIVHRDIKPSNVLIDMEGRVKVADFGLAKLTNNALNSGLTQTGMAMGTPDYVAPETLTLGTEVDGRADIYAVGVMLYQMLTGDIPRGMFKMPSQKFQSIDPRFDAIIRRALEHDREERYQSSHELRMALDVILTTPRAEPGQQSSAALPKQQQPSQVPGRTVVPSSRNPASAPQRRPAPEFEPPLPVSSPQQSSTMPYVIAAVAMLGFGGWFILQKNQPQGQDAAPVTADTVAAGNNPFEPSASTTSPAPSTSTTTPERLPPPSMSPPAASSSTSTTTRPSSSSSVSTPVPSPSMTTPKTSTPAPAPPAVPASSTISDRLAVLESQFQTAFERDVNTVFTGQLATLGTGYVAALDRAMQDAGKAGRLDEAIALREEKQRFTTHKFMPSIDPSGLHGSVVKLRTTYRSAEKNYSVQKDALSLPLYDRYIEVLSVLEKELLAQGKNADASRVRVKRDDVTARRKQRAAKVSSIMVPSARSTPALISLFDGQSLNGWRVVGEPQSFLVQNGEIRTNQKPGGLGLLVYVGSGGTAPLWKDFSVEFRFKCEAKSNSGIFLHVPDPSILTSRKVTAFEVNIDESAKATGGIMGAVNLETGLPLNAQLVRVGGGGGFGAGAKLLPGRPKFDEWQQMRIVAQSGVFTVWIDGEQVSSWAFPAGWTPPPDKGFLQTFEGTVALQCGFGRTTFKDITVEPL